MLLPALALAACAQPPQPADPALWRIDGPGGERGYLFGTIHALERPAAWRTAAVDRALRDADRIVVEVARVGDAGAMRASFEQLAHSPDQPPLAQRVPPVLRGRLGVAMDRAGLGGDCCGDLETWAAALMLARPDERGSRNGIDRAVIAAAGARPVIELEGAAAQLGVFDRLAEADQRDLLAAVVAEAGAPGGEQPGLDEAWRKGDMARIEAETRRGMLADPELRAALFTGRNRAWAQRIAALLGQRSRPFVAVGAAHMAGPEGLPAMLAAMGYRVDRIE